MESTKDMRPEEEVSSVKDAYTEEAQTPKEEPQATSGANETDDKERRYHHHHHHHGEHSTKSTKHGHHRSDRRRKKTKLKKFIKKHLYTLINTALLLVMVAVIVAVSLLSAPKINPSGSTGTDQSPTLDGGVKVTASSLQMEVPLFAEDVLLISEAVNAYLNRDPSIPAVDAVKTYKKDGTRLDVGLPVRLSYKVTGMPAGYVVIRATVEVSDNDKFTNPRVYTLKSDERSVDVYYLNANTQYYYRISLTVSGGGVTSVQGSFKTADTPRILSIDGLVNIRDIGGWKTTDGKTIRQGLVYRGSEMDGAIESSYKITPEGLNVMLSTLGVRTDLDLRDPSDNAYGTDALGANVEHIYIPTTNYSYIFSEEGRQSVQAIFSTLADQRKYPLYMHCTYGMDRTGTVCYLLEALLGVSEEDLMREYELSALYHGTVATDMMADFVAALNELPGDTMQAKVEGYLLSCGVTAQQISSIKSVLLTQ